MQIILQSTETKVLDSTIKHLLRSLDEIKYVELRRKKASKLHCRILCSACKVSVITQLELPEMVHISIKY